MATFFQEDLELIDEYSNICSMTCTTRSVYYYASVTNYVNKICKHTNFRNNPITELKSSFTKHEYVTKKTLELYKQSMLIKWDECWQNKCKHCQSNWTILNTILNWFSLSKGLRKVINLAQKDTKSQKINLFNGNWTQNINLPYL